MRFPAPFEGQVHAAFYRITHLTLDDPLNLIAKFGVIQSVILRNYGVLHVGLVLLCSAPVLFPFFSESFRNKKMH